MTDPAASHRLTTAWSWGRAVAIVLARSYRAMLLTLVAIAVLPTLFGLGSFVVKSGSMEPQIGIGDVALAKTIPADGKLTVGRVYVFDNPSRKGDLLIHRVVERQDDGLFVTAGDNNAYPDSTPEPRDAFTRQAVLLVPYVGKPIHWLQSGQWAPLVGVTLLTMAAFLLASRELFPDEEPTPELTPEPARKRRRRGALLGPVAALARTAYVRVPHAAYALVVLAIVIGASLATAQPTSAAFTSRTKSGSNDWATPARIVQPYVGAVLADNPSFFYLLDEPGGDNAADASPNGRGGTYSSVAYGRAGALPHNPGTAVQLGGLFDRIVEGGSARGGPMTFTAELWFKGTTPNAKLMGFESSGDIVSLQFDRSITIDGYGRLVYGYWTKGATSFVRSTKSYTDGSWHHLAVGVTTSGPTSTARMYVDGAKVAEGTTTRPSSYSGWWRVGYGMVPNESGSGSTTASLSATVDAVAVYPTELSAARISAHYAAR